MKRFLLAAAIVLACSASEGHAQQRTFNYNATGAWPGSGPYDSGIAKSGIWAGASIINNLINTRAQPRFVGVPVSPGFVQPQIILLQPQCYQAVVGQTSMGPLIGVVCR